MGKKKVLSMVELPAPDVADGDMVMIVDASEPVDADKNKKLSLKGYVEGGGLTERTFEGITEGTNLFTLDENEVIIHAKYRFSNFTDYTTMNIMVGAHLLLSKNVDKDTIRTYFLPITRQQEITNQLPVLIDAQLSGWYSGTVDIIFYTKILT